MTSKKPPVRKARLNNMKMDIERNTTTYEAVMLDLYQMGIISAEQCKAYTGREIPTCLKEPDKWEV